MSGYADKLTPISYYDIVNQLIQKVPTQGVVTGKQLIITVTYMSLDTAHRMYVSLANLACQCYSKHDGCFSLYYNVCFHYDVLWYLQVVKQQYMLGKYYRPSNNISLTTTRVEKRTQDHCEVTVLTTNLPEPSYYTQQIPKFSLSVLKIKVVKDTIC